MRKHIAEERNRIVGEFLEKYKGFGYRTIARAISRKHPSLFPKVENARDAVRYRMGAMGDAARGRRALDAPVRSKEESDSFRDNPYGLPTGDCDDYAPFRVDSDVRKMTVLSDVHVPYHSVEALKPAIARSKKYQPDALLLNGDFLDCHRISRFVKEPDAKSFKQELETARHVLDILLNEIAPTYVYYKEGNHEERYSLFMKQNAPEFLEIPNFRFQSIFGLDDLGAEWIDEKRVIHAGRLNVIHGHEYFGGAQSPVNPARGFFMKSKESVLVGHHHQTSEHTEPTIREKIITAFSVGCLCDLHPRYMRQNKWNHGFAEVNLDDSGDFAVDNYRIFRGKIL